MPTGTLTIERSALVAALTTVSRVVENRNTIPILANVLLTATEGNLHIRATDLEIDAEAVISCAGTIETTTAPARQLLDVVKRTPAGSELTLELDGPHLVVKAGRSRSKLAVIPPKDFPDIRNGEYASTFETDLSALLGQVAFAAGENDTREWANGVHIHDVDGGVHIVATNGYKLGCIEATGLAAGANVTLPRKLVGVVPQGVVKVSLGDARVRFEQGNVTIVSKLIESPYPDYVRVIPNQSLKTKATTTRKDLLESVERVGVFANERTGKAIRLLFSGETLAVSAAGPDGESSDEIESTYDDESIEVAFPSDSLAAMLRVVPGEQVSFSFSDSTSPVLVTGAGQEFRGVLVPMRA